MNQFATGLKDSIRKDRDLLTKIDEQQEREGEKLDKKNKDAKDLLRSNTLSFFTTMILLAISVAAFSAMISFIFVTKIIN